GDEYALGVPSVGLPACYDHNPTELLSGNQANAAAARIIRENLTKYMQTSGNVVYTWANQPGVIKSAYAQVARQITWNSYCSRQSRVTLGIVNSFKDIKEILDKVVKTPAELRNSNGTVTSTKS